MDIFNRIPAVSEDALVYNLYPSANATGKAAVTALAARIDEFIGTALPNHIWHRDAFELKVVRNKATSTKDGRYSSSGPDNRDVNTEQWMLEGYMRVGDSVDDEWLVVWILKEISEKLDVAIT